MKQTTNKVIDQNNSKPDAAQKRLNSANNYLKKHGININCRADDHYRNAILIAAGFKVEYDIQKPTFIEQATHSAPYLNPDQSVRIFLFMSLCGLFNLKNTQFHTHP